MAMINVLGVEVHGLFPGLRCRLQRKNANQRNKKRITLHPGALGTG